MAKTAKVETSPRNSSTRMTKGTTKIYGVPGLGLSIGGDDFCQCKKKGRGLFPEKKKGRILFSSDKKGATSFSYFERFKDYITEINISVHEVDLDIASFRLESFC